MTCIACGSTRAPVHTLVVPSDTEPRAYSVEFCACGLGATLSQTLEADSTRANHNMYDDVEDRVVTYFHRLRGHLTARFQESLRHVRATGNGGLRYLEVGSNIGFAASIARRDGFDVRVCELNDACREASKSLFGFRADKDFFEVQGEFDVLVMCDVLEHFPDPRAGLDKAASLLAPNGVLFVQLPNHGSAASRKAGPGWRYYCVPDHTFHFTRSSLAALGEKAGFNVVWARTIGFIDDRWYFHILPGPVRRTILRYLNAFEPVLPVEAKGDRGELLQMILRKS